MLEKQDLFIIGAGGLGREVLIWAQEIPAEARNWEVKGFLNSFPSAFDGYDIKWPIWGDPLDFHYTGEELVVCAIGDPQGKLKLCRNLVGRGTRFVSLIHPTALVSASVEVGFGCIVATAVMVSPGARIGAFTVILGSTFIGVDAVIGEGTTISAFAYVGNGAIIGEGVFLGSHAMVLPGAIVGDGARLGARTAVSGLVPAGTTFFGIPGQMISKDSRHART